MISPFTRKYSRRQPIRKGFTLIEILVVIGMIGILAATVLVAVNPLRQFAQARNAQRISNVNTILNAIGSRLADNKGIFIGQDCPREPEINPIEIASNSQNGIDLRRCLAPDYVADLPLDPSVGVDTCTEISCGIGYYNTGYTVSKSPSNRITVCAPHSVDDGQTTPYCLTR